MIWISSASICDGPAAVLKEFARRFGALPVDVRPGDRTRSRNCSPRSSVFPGQAAAHSDGLIATRLPRDGRAPTDSASQTLAATLDEPQRCGGSAADAGAPARDLERGSVAGRELTARLRGSGSKCRRR